MDAWELKQLRDFVRKKGRGSISKEPFEEEMIQLVAPSEDEPELDLMDMRSVLPGGMTDAQPVGPMLRPSSIIAPASYFATMKPNKSGKEGTKGITQVITTTKAPTGRKRWKGHIESSYPIQKSPSRQRTISTTMSPPAMPVNADLTKEDFKSLANLLQHIHARRKAAQTGEEKQKYTDQSTSAMGKWESMDETNETNEKPTSSPTTTAMAPSVMTTTVTMSKEEREAYVRQISEQISMILLMNKKGDRKRPTHQQLPPRPKLTIIRNGSAEQTADGRYDFVATISLVQDEGKYILVDTGMGTDINGRTQLLNKLSSMGLAPPNIDIVVSTHGHPDHNGGIHDFPDAIHYQGWYQHQNTKFNLSGLFEGDRHQLTENVYLMKSPGHSSDDISVVVKEEAVMGSLVIAGDTFLRKEDIDYQMMWKPLSANEAQQAESRRRLACGPWRWIVPGHGPPFPLEPSLRAKFGC